MSFSFNPGLVNPWLINRRLSLFGGDSDHFWREHPATMGRVYLSWVNIAGSHTDPLNIILDSVLQTFWGLVSGRLKGWLGPSKTSTQVVSFREPC